MQSQYGTSYVQTTRPALKVGTVVGSIDDQIAVGNFRFYRLSTRWNRGPVRSAGMSRPEIKYPRSHHDIAYTAAPYSKYLHKRTTRRGIGLRGYVG